MVSFTPSLLLSTQTFLFLEYVTLLKGRERKRERERDREKKNNRGKRDTFPHKVFP
jgi:hypothetical protein